MIRAATQYLHSYSFDCVCVAFTFSLSGYLCGVGRSMITFLHNALSIFLIRIPLAWLFTRLWPDSLFPMGAASPLGSLFSLLVILLYLAWCRYRGDDWREFRRKELV